MGSLEKWACTELEKLGVSDAGVIVHYLQPIEDPGELAEYLNAMLDSSQASNKKFIDDFLQKHQEAKTSVDSRFYRKPDLEEDKGIKEKKKQKGPKEQNGVTTKAPKEVSNVSQPAPATKTSSNKKKTKYVSLYSEEGKNKDVIFLRGRHKCDCQASKHKLISNCLKCGRIVCEQEGSGPCQFCGNLVVTREEREVLNKGARESAALKKRLFSEKNAVVIEDSPEEENTSDELLRKAVEHKNKLLEFDRTSEKRTRVFDDESDYFCTGSRWISHEDKMKLMKREEELRKKRFERGNQQLTIDFFGRKVIVEEEETGVYDPNDPVVKEILEGKSNDIFSAPDREESRPEVQVSRPEYTASNVIVSASASKKFSGKMSRLRVQDRELQEMTDDGFCLSMHQPWASLLVAGIKIHEGRTWYSAHRGRLWIAAAAKTPTMEEIKQLEHQYQVLLKVDNLTFPQHYPTGCLLGCVDVVDILPQEEYRAKFPDGESESPYVFICENPQEMILKFPVKGQHKIYKLDPKIHQVAKKAIKTREE